MDRQLLDELRRQVEEDYKLDTAAIDRLQRRYLDAASAAAARSTPGNSVPNGAPGNGVPAKAGSTPKWSEEVEARADSSSLAPPSLALPEWQRDELVGSLRTMFNVARK